MSVENGKFYRVNIKFLEPEKLSKAFIDRFHREVESNSIYLGIRFNPTNFNRSASINSLELAQQCIELAKEYLVADYGKVEGHIREFPCTSEFMESIIDTDTRTLMNYIQNDDFLSRVNTASEASHTSVQNIRTTLAG